MTEQITEWRGFAISRLSEVFDLVKPYPNWKMPIAAIIPKAAATEAEIEAAVVFYAGGVPEVRHLATTYGDRWHVLGAGYYAWVGA